MAVNNEGKAYRIAGGYKTSGDAIELGSVVVDDRPYPQCRVRIPMSTLTQHGVVLGATGGGKTKTLQMIAEQLSDAGVPVVMADIKGDLQGLAQPGFMTEPIVDRAIESGCDGWTEQSFPVEFASLGSEGVGIPIRASVESFGSILLAKALGFNPTQEQVLRLVMRRAAGPLHTLRDLREAVTEISRQIGGDDLGFISRATAGVMIRAIENLEEDGGETFFGAPVFNPVDLMRTAFDGRGYITLFELEDRAQQQAMFSIFLMWMLSQLAGILPEVGVVDKPKLVMVFDEAHTLFRGASDAFLEQLYATVKLIRSKGGGLVFCTQTSKDIPEPIMEQMGFRVLHALRVRTPEARRRLVHTAETFPESDIYDVKKMIPQLRKGEALVTALTEDGGETPVARTMIRPPRSHMGVIGFNAMRRIVQASDLLDKYRAEPEPDIDLAHDTAALPSIRLNLPPNKTLSFEELLAMTEPGYVPDT